jgi:tRNA A37 threonylcarbamoyladenosine dehydratase
MMNPNDSRHERTVKVIGADSLEKLMRSKVAVFGAGGVGGAAIEALARIGVGALDVIDGDSFSESNLNRQILATSDTVGQRKAAAAKDRILTVNPDCSANAFDMFITPENIGEIDFQSYDYVIDAIDNITAKLAVIVKCFLMSVPIVSCMGTGNKLDPTRFRITDISETSVCPLARVMRKELRGREIPGLDVLWSDEIPSGNCRPPGSVSFVPPAAGLLLAGFVIKKLI